MKYMISLLLIILVAAACSSPRMIYTYKSPERVMLHANKVLLVGMMPNEKVQAQFENRLREALALDSVTSFRSLDLFDVEFTSGVYSEEELDKYEQQLLDKDFDAILFTKIIGSENKQTLAGHIESIDELVFSFRDDYQMHQGLYQNGRQQEPYTLYQVETALYCICVDKERELAWKGVSQLGDPFTKEKTRENYIKVLTEELRKEQLLLGVGF